ncbi:MAG: hypothetical protein AAB074_02405 [Planctomycetota bacterium]
MLPEEAARFRIVHAIRDALPTRLHAEMLFEQVADLMGSAAWVERATSTRSARSGEPGGGSRLKLFRRDADAAERVAPWPLLEWLWFLGRRHLGRALFENRIPADAWFAAADALSGEAAAGGSTREEALAACLAEVHRVRPWLPREEAPLTMTDEEAAAMGARVLRMPAGDAPLPPPDPANVPLALASLGARPSERALFGEWRRIAGIKGIARWHIFKPEADGWTLFGNDLFGRFGPDWLRRAVKDADAGFGIDPPPPPPWPDDAPPLRVAVRTYRIAQPGRPEDSTLAPEDSWAQELQPWDLDNDVAGAVVTRMRWLKE